MSAEEKARENRARNARRLRAKEDVGALNDGTPPVDVEGILDAD
jgi:hypothetical protein